MNKPASDEATERRRADQFAATIQHETFALSLERAEAGDGEGRRVRGYASTFSVMHSGRMIHPAAAEEWLKKHPDAQLPLMAQHGFSRATFATMFACGDEREPAVTSPRAPAARAMHVRAYPPGAPGTE